MKMNWNIFIAVNGLSHQPTAALSKRDKLYLALSCLFGIAVGALAYLAGRYRITPYMNWWHISTFGVNALLWAFVWLGLRNNYLFSMMANLFKRSPAVSNFIYRFQPSAWKSVILLMLISFLSSSFTNSLRYCFYGPYAYFAGQSWNMLILVLNYFIMLYAVNMYSRKGPWK